MGGNTQPVSTHLPPNRRPQAKFLRAKTDSAAAPGPGPALQGPPSQRDQLAAGLEELGRPFRAPLSSPRLISPNIQTIHLCRVGNAAHVRSVYLCHWIVVARSPPSPSSSGLVAEHRYRFGAREANRGTLTARTSTPNVVPSVAVDHRSISRVRR